MAVITVKGSGKIKKAPDEITISMAVEGRDPAYEKALLLAENQVEALEKAAECAGFPEDSIRTANYNVRTEYEGVQDEKGNYRSVFSAYVCRYDLKLSFNLDLEKLRAFLAAVSAADARPELYIRFGLKDPEEAGEEMLKEAVKDARRKAELLAAEAGMRLGALLSIDYHVQEQSYDSPTMYAEEAALDGAGMKKAAGVLAARIVPEDVVSSDEAVFRFELLP